jgi:hypothetical protein
MGTTYRPALRLFRCICGHKLRFGSPRCGACLVPTPVYNRPAFWAVLAVAVLAMVAMAVVR